jgi:HD-like signal output (HDOD) protein
LSVANSPLYGIPRRVSTIDFAIVILGFNHIKNIVIALSMIEAFKTSGSKKFGQKKYWYHSILTAFAAKKIADDLGYAISGEAFTGGLLHDLGIPVIFKYFNKEYLEIIEKVKEDNINYFDAESEILGWTHSEIARSLVERWNLPSLLSDVVLFHHKPSEQEGDNRLTAIVHLADYMTMKLGVGDFSWDKDFKFDKEVIEILNLGDENYLEDFIESYRGLFSEQLEALNL